MKIRAELLKPYTNEEKINFIVLYNHNNNYIIEETETALLALSYTQDELDLQEQSHIQQLSMTKSDFFDGTIKAFGLDQDDLQPAIELILTQLQISEIDKKVAMNNYKNAKDFYRKHTLFTLLSDREIPISETQSIKISSTQWDKFFDETNKGNKEAYKELIGV